MKVTIAIAIAIATLVLAGCGADPTDAWVGSWSLVAGSSTIRCAGDAVERSEYGADGVTEFSFFGDSAEWTRPFGSCSTSYEFGDTDSGSMIHHIGRCLIETEAEGNLVRFDLRSDVWRMGSSSNDKARAQGSVEVTFPGFADVCTINYLDDYKRQE